MGSKHESDAEANENAIASKKIVGCVILGSGTTVFVLNGS